MYPLTAFNGQRSVVEVAGVRFGDGGFVAIGGPCAIESEAQIERAAELLAAGGAAMLRGGAYKPRTSPYSFQGLGDEGVLLIERAAARHALPTVVEVLAVEDVPFVSARVAMLQIGARNMQNVALLRAAGRTGKAILLKRGPAATLDEVLAAAEYILMEGNAQVVLCERGLRGFDRHTRNLFDLAGALRLRELTHLPVIVDPSHATGRRSLVVPMALAAVAAGLDGAILEVHPEPAAALSDAEQALAPEEFAGFTRRLGALREAVKEPLLVGR